MQARNQIKIPEGAKSFTLKSTRQGNNDGELYPKCIGCKAKRQRLQRDGGAIAGAMYGAIAQCTQCTTA